VIDQIENDQVYDKYLSKYIAYYPLLAVTIAASFDVGWFYAVDIHLFTLFTLSEHILFALEALPLAIAILLMATIFLPAMLSRFQPAKPSSPVVLPWRKKLLAIGIVLLAFGVVLGVLGLLIYNIWKQNPFVLVVGLLLILSLGGGFIVDPKFKQLYVSVAAVFACIVVSFSFGLAFGAGILTNLRPVTTVKLKNEQATINGGIIRSGERGVLFYEREANLIRFIPWEGISSIETQPTKFGEQ
jgi:hypothetical protein